MPSKKINPVSAWFETATAMNAATSTILMRTFQMQQDFLAGRTGDNPENALMVTEKAAAMNAGAIAAGREWSKIWWGSAMSGAFPTASAMADAGPAIIMAAARPGFKTARANAKRLSRRRKR